MRWRAWRSWPAPRRVLAVWLALSFPLGTLPRLLAPWPAERDQLVNAVLGVLTTIFVYAWCRADAAARGTVAPGRSALWAGLFPPLGWPLYLWRTRGLRRSVPALLQGLLFWLGTLLAFASVEYSLQP